MPFSFPSSPTVGQQSTQNGRVYSWTGSAWEIVPIPTSVDAGNLTGTVALARLPSLPASQIGSGTLDAARLPTATKTQAEDGESAVVAMSPVRSLDQIQNVLVVSTDGFTYATSGQTTVQQAFGGVTGINVGSGSGGGSIYGFVRPVWSPTVPKWNGSTGNWSGRYINWTRRQRFRLRIQIDGGLPSANATYRVLLGKTSPGVAAIGALSARGVGFEIRSAGALWLTSHNGTTRTDTQASSSLAANTAYDLVVDCSGGTANLYLDGALVATNSGAPATVQTDFLQAHFTLEATTTDLSPSSILFQRAILIFQP